jgi:hypothetical protein
MITLLISNAITAGLAVGTSWYISHRGLQGVKNDVANAKAEVEKIKASVFPATPAATPAA